VTATPLIPGLLYAVRHAGQLHYISAANGAAAIAKFMEGLQ